MELHIYNIMNLESKMNTLSSVKRFIDIENKLDCYIDKTFDDIIANSFSINDGDTIELGKNSMRNVLDIHNELNVEINLGYGNSDTILNLTDLDKLVDELYNNNIVLDGFSFNWFKESWSDEIYLIFWNFKTNQVLLFC